MVAANKIPTCHTSMANFGNKIKKNFQQQKPQKYVINHSTDGNKNTQNPRGHRLNLAQHKGLNSRRGSNSIKDTPKILTENTEQTIPMQNKFAPLQVFIDNETDSTLVQQDLEYTHLSFQSNNPTVQRLTINHDKRNVHKTKHQSDGHSRSNEARAIHFLLLILI